MLLSKKHSTNGNVGTVLTAQHKTDVAGFASVTELKRFVSLSAQLSVLNYRSSVYNGQEHKVRTVEWDLLARNEQKIFGHNPDIYNQYVEAALRTLRH